MLSGLFTLLLVAAGVVGAGIAIVSNQSKAPGPLASDRAVIIPKDSGLTEIAELLQREGLIEHPLSFRIAAVIGGDWHKLKAGEYLFKARVSPQEILDVISSGKVVEHSITIPEGLTSEQIVERLRENDLLTGEIAQIPKEGSILPDTYRFPRGFSRKGILDRMARDQNVVLEKIWAKRPADLPIKTPQELVVLASIVEKETGRADERPRVAGVFINRLNQKMKLQSDPTIVYGLVGGKGTLGRPIKRSEIQQPSPYNTYVIDGLPPGPIANPGRASLEATANPARTRDLFFVADGSGGHTFTENYNQHQSAVSKLRALERQQQNDTAEPDDAPPPAGTTGTTPQQQPTAQQPPAGQPAHQPAGKKKPRAANGAKSSGSQDALNRYEAARAHGAKPHVRGATAAAPATPDAPTAQ